MADVPGRDDRAVTVIAARTSAGSWAPSGACGSWQSAQRARGSVRASSETVDCSGWSE
jgi:hypothetical protein